MDGRAYMYSTTGTALIVVNEAALDFDMRMALLCQACPVRPYRCTARSRILCALPSHLQGCSSRQQLSPLSMTTSARDDVESP